MFEQQPFPFKLGRLPVKYDYRTLHGAKYMKEVSPPPPAVDYASAVPTIRMYANDEIGDCTFAALGHATGLWTYDATKNEFVFTDNQIIKGYSDVSGYNPVTGANDNGCNELDVLNYWRKTGVAGHKLLAYVALDITDHFQLMQAINLFGAIYTGFNVPQSAIDQNYAGQTWDVVANDGGIVGGHAVSIGEYDANGLTCFTWAMRQRMTWRFWDAYFEESYAIVTVDWLDANGKDPQGFDIDTLQVDLVAVGNKQPTPTPTPTPTPGVSVTGVSVSPTSLSLAVGKEAQLSVVVTPSNAADPSVTWTSQNPNVASVDSAGNVTGIAKGATVVTATANDTTNGTLSGQCALLVTPGSGCATLAAYLGLARKDPTIASQDAKFLKALQAAEKVLKS